MGPSVDAVERPMGTIELMLKTMTLLAVLPFASAMLSAQESKEAVLPESRPASDARYAKLGDLPGCKAVVKYSDRLYRGAQPQTVEGMLALKKLGVTTILSVEE